jgi:hypothetical protein
MEHGSPLDTIQFPQQPENYRLENGQYVCSTRVSKVKVTAGGDGHIVAGATHSSAITVQ